jgi:hypothetical protein
MRRTRAALVAAATAAAALSGGGAATAAPASYAEPTVSWVSPTVLTGSAGGGFAMVQARYRCSGGDVGTHLYIAVKQGPTIGPENTSSAGATAYYSTNWGTDGPALSLHCDGAEHTQQFRLKQDPYWGHAPTPLAAGPALIQFCMFDSTATEGAENGFVLDYSMGTVRVLN